MWFGLVVDLEGVGVREGVLWGWEFGWKGGWGGRRYMSEGVIGGPIAWSGVS